MTDVEEINSIKDWLSKRPSATMDPCLEERWRKLQRLRELKSIRRREGRRTCKMMQAQNESMMKIEKL